MTLGWKINYTHWLRNSRYRLKKTIILITLGLISVVIMNCSDPLVFSVMGDTPRSDEEKIILQEQISMHNKLSQSQFLFHLGDIKSGESPCTENNYELVADYLKQLTVPVFIIPGDNEWNDCEYPDQAWGYWNKYFMAFDQNWKMTFDVHRQKNYSVNSAFIQKNVLFIALNLVGGRIHNQIEWDMMQNNAAEWIKKNIQKKGISAAVFLIQANPDTKHKLFMDQFIPLIENFMRPVLLIHGDGHHWLYDEAWQVPNLIRVQVDKGGIADPLQVTVSGNTMKKFQFERYPFRDKE